MLLVSVAVFITFNFCTTLTKGDVGNAIVDISEHPYQAQLSLFGYHICGAVIIHPQILLTAGHCLTHEYVYYMKPYVGTTIANLGGQEFIISSFLIHPNYEENLLGCRNDIGLILIDREIQFNSNANVIRIAIRKPHAGSEGVVTGYGLAETEESYDTPQRLKEAKAPIISDKQCVNMYDGFDRNQHICAGLIDATPNAYLGDSGGPLIVDTVLVGIASFSRGGTYPAVFTFVGAYKKWIEDSMSSLFDQLDQYLI